MLPYLYNVYGLTIATDHAFPEFVSVAEDTKPDVRIWVDAPPPHLHPDNHDWQPHAQFSSRRAVDQGPEPNLRILQSGDLIRLLYWTGTSFVIDWANQQIGVTGQGDGFFALLSGPVLGFLLRLKGFTGLHASAVVANGKALVFTGVRGAGKSTTAGAFAQYGFSVLTDDITPLLTVEGQWLIPPGYRRLRLWKDAASTINSGMPLAPVLSGMEKYFYSLEQPVERTPLGAIYHLKNRDASLARPDITSLTPKRALLTLVAHTYANYMIDNHMRQRDFYTLSELVKQIPVYDVILPGDIRDLQPNIDSFL
jgi:hypothetical protein